MKFSPPLISGKLIKRYKRFMADIRLDNNEVITAHCPNSGRMTQCQGENWPVLITPNNNPKRKLKYTWELIHNGKTWICINTQKANEIVYEALTLKKIPELNHYTTIQREVKYGQNSRIDFLLSNNDKRCYLEVKSVSLLNDKLEYSFPDAPTERGKKHLQELINMKNKGYETVLLYVLNRNDGKGFSSCSEIDPEYSELLKIAKAKGVKVLIYSTIISPESIQLSKNMKWTP